MKHTEQDVKSALDAFSYAESGVLSCPKCGHENVHMKSVAVMNGDDSYESHLFIHEGKNIKFGGPIKTPNRNQDLSLVIRYECECEHIWDHIQIFHKGTTYIQNLFPTDK